MLSKKYIQDAAIILMLGACLAHAHAQNGETVLDRNKEALVSVYSYEFVSYNYQTNLYTFDTLIMAGCGFIISEGGLVGTCFHVVEYFDSIAVRTYDSVFYPATVLYADEQNDIAILRVTCDAGIKFRTGRLGNSDILKTGQTVFAVGNPLGYEYTVSQGIICGIRENEVLTFGEGEDRRYEKVIQTDAAISPGNSGGALFNADGEIIGVCSYYYQTYGNLNFATAINLYKKLTDPDSSFKYIYEQDENERFLDYKLYILREAANQLKGTIRNNNSTKPRASNANNEAGEPADQDSVNTLNFKKAEDLYFKCIELDSEYFSAYEDLADLYLKADDTCKAEEVFKKVYSIPRFRADFSTIGGMLERYHVSHDNVEKIIKIYAGLDSGDSEIHYRLGQIYLRAKKPSKSEKEFMKVVSIDPENYRALFQLGRIFSGKNENLKARKYFRLSYEEYTNSEDNNGRRRRERFDDDFSLFDLHYNLSKIYMQDGKKLTAMMHYMKMEPVTKAEIRQKEELYKRFLEYD